MDYNQSHVVTSVEYSKILQGKTLKKKTTKKLDITNERRGMIRNPNKLQISLLSLIKQFKGW